MADRATLMTREIEAHEFIPYGRHIDVHTITVGSQGLMTMVEIEGFAFETADIRGSLMAYLFERIERTITGDRIVIAIDEFWKALGDPVFSDLANNKPKTIRKQNGLVVFATQSPADALRSMIAHTIIVQCPTQVFMANGRASESDYVSGMKLTAREFELVARELTPESRRFLIKQGHASVVAELDLSGFDDDLAILSGRTANERLADNLREERDHTEDSSDNDWMAAFHRRRRA